MNMPSKRDLCCREMKALRAEIDRRARNLTSGRAFEGRGQRPFAGTPTPALIRTLRGRQRAIYGTDDRKDIYQVTNAELLALVDSVAALVEAPDLRATPSGRLSPTTSSYKVDYELCDGETFASQPLGCFCSGFLLAPDVIATVGHCVRRTISARRPRHRPSGRRMPVAPKCATTAVGRLHGESRHLWRQFRLAGVRSSNQDRRGYSRHRRAGFRAKRGLLRVTHLSSRAVFRRNCHAQHGVGGPNP